MRDWRRWLRVGAVGLVAVLTWMSLQHKHSHEGLGKGVAVQSHLARPNLHDTSIPTPETSSLATKEANAPSQGGPTNAAESGTGLLRVRVVTTSGVAVPGTLVYACSPNSGAVSEPSKTAVAITGEDGAAGVVVSEFPCDLVAMHIGYLTQVARQDALPPEQADPILIQIESGLAISGSVRTTGGLPMAGMRVMAFGAHSGGMWRRPAAKVFGSGALPDVHEVASGQDGTFEIRGLRPGQYVLTAIGPGSAPKLDSMRGVVPVEAGQQGVLITVAPTYLVCGRAISEATKRPITLSHLFVEYEVPNAPGLKWSVGTVDQQVAGETAPKTGPGVFQYCFQAEGLASEHPVAKVTISGIGFEREQVEIPLVPFDPEREPTPIEVVVREDPRPRGKVLFSVPAGVRADDFSPYPLLLREKGSADERWGRREVPLSDAGPTAIELPAGEYEYSGLFPLTAEGGVKLDELRVTDGGETRVAIGCSAGALGAVEIDVTDQVGSPLSDFYYRLVRGPSWDKGQDHGIRQGFIGGEPRAKDDPILVRQLPAEEFVVVVTKIGYGQTFERVTVRGAQTTKVNFVLGGR